MLGIDLVRPLEENWRESLDAVGRARDWPTSQHVAKLGQRVEALSAAYNDPNRARAGAREGGAARLGFSFARDVPKGAAAVRELLALGVLAREGPLRVLDLGAGLGAMTWGLTRARAAMGGSGSVEATWIDSDRAALDLGLAIVQERTRRAPAEGAPIVSAVGGSLAASSTATVASGTFDVVFVGQTLSELDVGGDPAARAEAHAAWLRLLLARHVGEHGSLVVVEPALRDRTRHLHRVRDAVVAAGGATVFAPCTHGQSCPALADERDWCHEHLPVDLPPWLVPVARAAGLRYEGLSFSYLVLRKDGTTLASAARLAGGRRALRVVSDRIKTKGKLERFLCGALRSGEEGSAAGRVRVTRLDRDATEANKVWSDLARGDVVTLADAADVADAADAADEADGKSGRTRSARIGASDAVGTLEIL